MQRVPDGEDWPAPLDLDGEELRDLRRAVGRADGGFPIKAVKGAVWANALALGHQDENR